MSELREKIDRLLHDAEHAKHGAEFARNLKPLPTWQEDAERMEAKVRELVAQANALDPNHTAPSWEDADV
jgi:hypothetical protein